MGLQAKGQSGHEHHICARIQGYVYMLSPLGLAPTLLKSRSVTAVLAFGPPVRSAGNSWTHGGGDKVDGSANRTEAQNAGLQPYADAGILREYCQPGDPICAPHSDNPDMKNHMAYFDKFGEEGAAWVIELARNASSRVEEYNARQASDSSGIKEMFKKTVRHPVASGLLALIFVAALW